MPQLFIFHIFGINALFTKKCKNTRELGINAENLKK